MTEEVLAGSLASAGYRVHCSRGVWWQQVSTLFAKPVNPLRVIEPGASSPAHRGSLLGYSHVVAGPGSANWVWPVMLLDHEHFAGFRLEGLSRGKRSSVKKALRELEIRPIADLDEHLGAMAEICISQAIRTGHGRPPSYYSKNRRQWMSFMRREFSIPSREWLGAFSGSRLVAYYYAFAIDGTLYISAAKSHSGFLDSRPNDGLLFSVIERYQARGDFRQAIFGGWSPDAPTLNAFKEGFGFRRWDVPVYRYLRWPVRLGLWLRARVARWRR